MKEKNPVYKLVIVDTSYCDFLRKYDYRVSYNANEKELRPFVGVLLTMSSIGIYADYFLSAIGAFFTMISGSMVYSTPSRRAIHDYIAHTMVVDVDEKPPVKKERKRKNKHKKA